MNVDERLLVLLRSQHLVVSRAQALAAGLSRHGIAHRIERRRLERVGQSCLRLFGATETWHQLLTVGLLDLGDGAVVTDRSAAGLHRFDTFAPGPVELQVPVGVRRRTPVGRVRLGAKLADDDVVVVDGLATLSPTMTLLQLAALVSRPRLQHALDGALRDGLTTLTLLEQRLSSWRRSGRGGVRAIEEVIGRATSVTAHSVLERRFLDLVLAHGLALPEGQAPITTSDGATYRVDALYRPERLVVELQSQRWHSGTAAARRDAQRRAALARDGYRVVPYTYAEVDGQPAWVMADLRQELEARRPQGPA